MLTILTSLINDLKNHVLAIVFLNGISITNIKNFICFPSNSISFTALANAFYTIVLKRSIVEVFKTSKIHALLLISAMRNIT